MPPKGTRKRKPTQRGGWASTIVGAIASRLFKKAKEPGFINTPMGQAAVKLVTGAGRKRKRKGKGK